MFEIILKSILTAALLYLTLNTFLTYHVSADRVILFTIVLLLLLCLAYYDTAKVHEFILTACIIVGIGIILKVISVVYRKPGYFLFNIYHSAYKEVQPIIYELAETYEIKKENINYNQFKPWVIVFKDTSLKQSNKLMKEFSKRYAKTHRKVSLYNYWYTVVVLILIAALWRF